jgi:hypothetical protein
MRARTVPLALSAAILWATQSCATRPPPASWTLLDVKGAGVGACVASVEPRHTNVDSWARAEEARGSICARMSPLTRATIVSCAHDDGREARITGFDSLQDCERMRDLYARGRILSIDAPPARRP